MPLIIVREKYAEYTRDTRLGILEAQELLQKRLMERLKLQIGDGEIVSTAFDTSLEGDVLKVTLRAECLEQIAAERPFTPEELQQATLPPPENTAP